MRFNIGSCRQFMMLGTRRFNSDVKHFSNALANAIAAPSCGHLCVYRNDLLVRCLNRYHVHWLITGLMFLMLFLGAKVFLTWAAGVLVSPTLLSDLSWDLWTLPPLEAFRWLAASFLDVFHLARPEYLVGPPKDAVHTSSIPYLRDYVDMSVMTISAFHMSLIQRQWQRLSHVVDDFREHGVLDKQLFSDSQYHELVREYNQWFGRKRLNVIALSTSITLVALVLLTFHAQGIYSGLTQGSAADTTTWQRAAYANWWANTNNGVALFAFNAVVWVVILYYIILHNIIGFGVIRMLRRTRNHLGEGASHSLFEPQPGHYDGVSGFGVARHVMVYVYLSILASGICLLLGYYYMPRGGALVLTPLILLFVAIIPLFVMIPTMIFGRELRQWKSAKLAELFRVRESLYRSVYSSPQPNAPDSSREAGNVGLLNAVQARYKEILDMPTSLFSARRVSIYFITYGLVVLGFLLQLGDLLRR